MYRLITATPFFTPNLLPYDPVVDLLENSGISFILVELGGFSFIEELLSNMNGPSEQADGEDNVQAEVQPQANQTPDLVQMQENSGPGAMVSRTDAVRIAPSA